MINDKICVCTYVNSEKRQLCIFEFSKLCDLFIIVILRIITFSYSLLQSLFFNNVIPFIYVGQKMFYGHRL